MEAAQALADLTEISSQIESAVIVDEAGTIAGATLADGSRLAEAGRALLQKAEDVHGSRPAQLEAATADGSVFVLSDGARTIVAELRAELKEHAYLEGDFVLRSGRHSRYYLDKYRFETRPELLRALGERIVEEVREHEPEAMRLAGPELGAVALAAAASLESGLPFLIVRKEQQGYGTGTRLEGMCVPGDRVGLLEVVITSGGAA